MSSDACCTCASLLSSIPPLYDEKTEKPPRHERRTQCCGRAICARCISDNPRFATYCPFCQVSEIPSTLPQGLRDPPAYSPLEFDQATLAVQRPRDADEPPAYDVHDPIATNTEKRTGPAPDVLHFVDPDNDTMRSLSLRYGVPISALRRCNNMYSDHLIQARRTVLIPGEYYKGGVSLSPRPLEGEEEEVRKTKVRKWMVACKCAEYEVALLYLKQADYNLDAAVEAYKEDEQWEKDHPLESQKGKGKAKDAPRPRRRGLGLSMTGQII